jgi:ligand-binding sensor domain-containing protein
VKRVTEFAVRIIFVILFITTFITTSALSGRGGFWQTYQYLDGLSDNRVYAIHQERDGNIWFGTERGDVSRFDGKEWTIYPSKDGLAHPYGNIYQDHEGNMWFGTYLGGVSRFDGKEWTTFTIKEGLADNLVADICQDSGGNIWFGTLNGGLSKFDGRCFQTINVNFADKLEFRLHLSPPPFLIGKASSE